MSDPGPGTKYGFGIGTFGRDAAYTLVSMYLIFYLTDALRVSTGVLAATTTIMVVARIFDAVNDPFVGVLIDNSRSKWGKFKPWILGGAIGSGILMILLFTDVGLGGGAFVAYFAVAYLLWGIFFTGNDVGYWSMLPALSQSQRTREKIGSIARISASLGAFSMVVGLVPITSALTKATGSAPKAFFILAVAAALIMLLFQMITVIFTKEDRNIPGVFQKTRFRELGQVIFKNDQLLAAAGSMTLFTIGYTTTVTLGIYYFKYVYGDENMYSLFALVLGVSQIGTLAAYPLVARNLRRSQIYTLAIALVTVGYVVFFFAEAGAVILSAGLLLFVGQALIQMLVLMFIADSVEYGQWKLGRRNESVTFSLQPFINKMGAAIASGIAGGAIIFSRIQQVPRGEVLSGTDLCVFKFAMMILPLMLIGISYLLYRRFYKIDETLYNTIVTDLRERNQP